MLNLKKFISSFYPNRVIISIISSFVMLLLFATACIYEVLIQQTKQHLQENSKRIQEDIIYNDGKWDLFSYNADPKLPDTYPLYIISLDGFVIERWRPVHGYLDKSNISRLLTYGTPQTIHTVTDENWRTYARPIIENNSVIGVITVSKFSPDLDNLKNVDKELQKNASIISSKLKVSKNIIDTSDIDIRHITYDIAYEVVDRFNTILLKNNNGNSIDHLPDFTDRGYVGSVLSLPTFIQIQDSITHEPFLINNSVMKDKQGNIVGIIAVGTSVAYIFQALLLLVIFTACFTILLLLFLIPYINNIVKDEQFKKKKTITNLSFHSKEGKLAIDNNMLQIPFDTNQYYLCEAIFSNPKKKWETDELLKRFGEHELTNWHKVYDAMRLVNKRTTHLLPEKLIILKDKTYQLNPSLYKHIS